ncbi:MAG: AarF/ABC1/UbiB kinase family protein [Bacteroidota bacterium]
MLRPIKNLNRIQQVIRLLLRYGFQDIVLNTQLRRRLPQSQQQRQVAEAYPDRPIESSTKRWENLRLIIEELGPTFIKLAQVLSNRPDLLPDALIAEFEKLQDDVPPFSVDLARSIVEVEIGKPIEEVFSYFDDTPLGAASIGQVHRARLKTGEDVVIKVQRPTVADKVVTDLSLLREFVKLTETYFVNAGILNPLDVVETFDQSMRRELDYKIEARNMEQFHKLYGKKGGFHIPTVYKELSTSKVLVIEFVAGCKITDIKQLKAWGLSPEKMAERGMKIYLEQIFEGGFFHADPHPGNIIIRPNGSITLIDYGMTGKLRQQEKFAFAGVFISLARQDSRGMAISLRRLAVDSEVEDIRMLERDLNGLIEDYIVMDTGDLGMQDLTARLQRISYNYQMKIPGSVFLVLRALAILEGIGTHLHPEFESFDYIKPYGVKLMTEQYSFDNISGEVTFTASQLASLLYTLPVEIRYILKKVKKDNVRLNIDIRGYKSILRKVDSTANKIILTIFIAALIIGGSIAAAGDYNPDMPRLWGIPYLSLFGYILAIMLTGILSLYTISRRDDRE